MSDSPPKDSALERLQRFAKRMYYLKNWPVMYQRTPHCGVKELNFRNGMRLRYNEADPISFLFNEIFILDSYFSGNFHQLSPRDTVVDIGANIGMFALYCQYRCPGVSMHCFEPASQTRQRLEENVSINGLKSSVRVYPYGVAKEEASKALLSARYAGSRSIYESPSVSHENEEQVRCVPLGAALEICQADTVDLMKVDVEGAEIDIFEGAQPSDLKRIKKLAVEYHDGVSHKRDTAISEFLLRKLQENGFRHIEQIPDPAPMDSGLIRAVRN